MKERVSSILTGWITESFLKKNIELTNISTVDFPSEEDTTGISISLNNANEDSQGFFSTNDNKGSIRGIEQNKISFQETGTDQSVAWEEVEKDIYNSLSWESLRAGEPTDIEFIIKDLSFQVSIDEIMKWIYNLFLNNTDNILLVCSLVHAISHFEYEDVYPLGPMMAMALLSHNDVRVELFAIKAFSNWNARNTIAYMENFSPKYNVARKEWIRVIQYIKENGDEWNGILDENDKHATVDTRTA